jgi:hypothetical protein
MDANNNILAYLRGDLTPEARQQFEQQMAQDESLAREVAQQGAAWQLMAELPEQQRLRTQVGEWMQEAQRAEAPASRTSRPLWRYAAMAAGVLLLAALIYLFQPSPTPPDALFADYYQPYPYSQRMGDSSPQDSLFEEGVSAYKREAFEQAVSLLAGFSASDPHFEDAQMLTAASLLQQEKFGDAIPFFQGLQESPKHGEAARWYLAWAYLMSEKPAEASRLFQQIAEAEGYKSREAREVMKRME